MVYAPDLCRRLGQSLAQLGHDTIQTLQQIGFVSPAFSQFRLQGGDFIRSTRIDCNCIDSRRIDDSRIDDSHIDDWRHGGRFNRHDRRLFALGLHRGEFSPQGIHQIGAFAQAIGLGARRLQRLGGLAQFEAELAMLFA